MNRRELIRLGTVTLSGAVLASACGAQPNVESSGNVASAGTAVPNDVTPQDVVADYLQNPNPNASDELKNEVDVVLLRTAASLEESVSSLYDAIVDVDGLLGGNAAALLRRFRDDHRRHADAVNALVRAAGGSAWTKSNPRIDDRYFVPARAAVNGDGNPDAAVDAVVLAHAAESLAGQTYQGVVGMLTSASLRAAAIGVGQEEARHAVVLAQFLNPGYAGVTPAVDADGRPTIASVPSTFGTLSSVQVRLGDPGDTGTKQTFIFETPSLNSLIYTSMS